MVAVTGGARGIGESTMHRFAAEGATLVLIDVNAEGAARVADDVRSQGGNVDVCVADIGGERGWSEVANFVDRSHGRLDVVVNNATGPEVGPLLQISEAGWQRTFDTNVSAVLALGQGARAADEVLGWRRLREHLVERGAARGARAGCLWGRQGRDALAHPFARARARASGIRANSITPGVILSPMIAQQVDAVGRERFERGLGTRCGTPDELARVVLFLASDDAAYINGENIQVDGGWFAGVSPGLRFD